MDKCTYYADRGQKYEPYVWLLVFSIIGLFLFFSIWEGLKIMEVDKNPLWGFLFALIALYVWGTTLKNLLDSLFNKSIRSLTIEKNELSISYRKPNFKIGEMVLPQSETSISFEDYWEDGRKQRIKIFAKDGHFFTMDAENWTENLLQEVYAKLRKRGYRKQNTVD